MLSVQYRMNQQIMEWSSQVMYGLGFWSREEKSYVLTTVGWLKIYLKLCTYDHRLPSSPWQSGT